MYCKINHFCKDNKILRYSNCKTILDASGNSKKPFRFINLPIISFLPNYYQKYQHQIRATAVMSLLSCGVGPIYNFLYLNKDIPLKKSIFVASVHSSKSLQSPVLTKLHCSCFNLVVLKL